MRRLVIALGLTAALAGATPAAAQQGEGAFDARARERAAITASGAPPARRPTAAMRRARGALQRSLGRQGVVDVDPLTGTPRVLARLDGALTGPRRGDPADVAQRYVREHVAALGLTPGDLGSLGGMERRRLPGGAQQIRWRQFHAGVPALDNELRVTVTAAGEVLNVLGSPQHDLEPALGAPRVGVGEALRAAGADRVPAVTAAGSGPQRRTRFASGDEAALVVFGEGDRARLAWRVTHRESSQAVYDTVVDAGSGRVLRRVNQVKRLDVVERHPGAPAVSTYDFQAKGWLPPGAATLAGPNAHAWADVDDSLDEEPGPGEEVPPADYGLQTFNPGGPGCDELPCTWDSSQRGSWEFNREQATVQAFYYVNRFHDWLGSLGFTDGAMEGADRVLVQALDGAAGPGGLPNAAHRNNANMYTPPDGQSPVMQMYLFTTRDVHGGDDAAIVYHEYTHGLTNRLVTDAGGRGALTSPQSGAMGEGWSDYFAMDFLVEHGYQPDAPDPDLTLGAYTDGEGTPQREQAIDCPVGSTAPRCPGGGFTYDDFGAIGDGPDVHRDGEIWSQTLWDLRTALGAATARRLVLEALSLSPPEPSFLDVRNAILLAGGSAHRDAIWQVFAARGMGWYAATHGSSDVDPSPSHAAAPAPGTPAGALSGRVVDAASGRAVGGASVSVGGHVTVDRQGQPFPGSLLATADAAGAFSLLAPVGTYEEVTVSAGDGHDPVTLADVAVPSSGRLVRLNRNWTAAAGGARVRSVTGVETEYQGCLPEQVIDQDLDTGLVADRDGTTPTIVFALPRAVDVTGFAADPGTACGDPPGAGLRRFGVDVSVDGSAWEPREYVLGPEAAHVRTRLGVGSGSPGVRFVRLRLLEPQHAGAVSVAFSELSVFGNGHPVARLAVPAEATALTPVTLDASGTEDPDGTIVRYEWDFNGDGRVDRATGTPTTSLSYLLVGTYRPAVTVVDSGGARASAGATVVVHPRVNPSPPPPDVIELRDPALTVPRTGRRARVTVRVRCDTACFGPVRLRIDRRTARRLKLGKTRIIGRAQVRLAQRGERRVTVKLTRKAVRALKRRKLRTVRVTLTVSVRDLDGRTASARRKVRIRR